MNKHAKKNKNTKSIELKVVASTRDVIRPALLQTVLGLGLEQIYEIVEEERAALCGPKHARVPSVTRSAAAQHPVSSCSEAAESAFDGRVSARWTAGKSTSRPGSNSPTRTH